MTTYFADAAWIDGSVQESVSISVANGLVSSIDAGPPAADAMRLNGWVLPGFVNAHSHVFHRVLRGNGESGGDFWTWRQAMYAIAGRIDPDLMRLLATSVYAEMASAGFTTVFEFHYLHHGRDGHPYTEANVMSLALVEAAADVGIKLVLLDTCYLTSDIDGSAPSGVQRRFSDGSAEQWAMRHAQLGALVAGRVGVILGRAIHSVRAVPEAAVAELAGSDELLHVHVSEQRGENEECRAATGMTPVELLDNAGVWTPKTTAVHGVHVTDSDVSAIAGGGSSVCVCPTTEHDLGDGTVDSDRYVGAGVPLSLGTDSHVSIDPFVEVRQLEWNDRARFGRRGVHPIERLLSAATSAGRLVVGEPADFVVVDPTTARTSGATLAGLVMAASAADVTDVYVDGVRIVTDGQHPMVDSLTLAIRAVLDV